MGKETVPFLVSFQIKWVHIKWVKLKGTTAGCDMQQKQARGGISLLFRARALQSRVAMSMLHHEAWRLQSLAPQASFHLLWWPLTHLTHSMGPHQSIPRRLASLTHALSHCSCPLQWAAQDHHKGLHGIFWDLPPGQRDGARLDLAR